MVAQQHTNKEEKEEHISLAVRINPSESQDESVEIDLPNRTIKLHHTIEGEPKEFICDHVLPKSYGNRDVFVQAVLPLVDSWMRGYNATVLAYGATGAGRKSTLMGGNLKKSGDEEDGVLPSLFSETFRRIQVGPTIKIYASVVELYGGKCRDMLNPDSAQLNIREGNDKLFRLLDLTQKPATNSQDLHTIINTALSHSDSEDRSQFVYILTLERDGQEDAPPVKSTFTVVDLIGCEHRTRTEKNSEMSVSLSLSALHTVVDATLKGRGHVPYRSSPLTMLLKDSLGGTSTTLVIASISTQPSELADTLHTLQFGSKIRQIKNYPKVQTDSKEMRIAELTAELNALRKLNPTDVQDELFKVTTELNEVRQNMISAQINLQRSTDDLQKKSQELEENKLLTDRYSNEAKLLQSQIDDIKGQKNYVIQLVKVFAKDCSGDTNESSELSADPTKDITYISEALEKLTQKFHLINGNAEGVRIQEAIKEAIAENEIKHENAVKQIRELHQKEIDRMTALTESANTALQQSMERLLNMKQKMETTKSKHESEVEELTKKHKEIETKHATQMENMKRLVMELQKKLKEDPNAANDDQTAPPNLPPFGKMESGLWALKSPKKTETEEEKRIKVLQDFQAEMEVVATYTEAVRDMQQQQARQKIIEKKARMQQLMEARENREKEKKERQVKEEEEKKVKAIQEKFKNDYNTLSTSEESGRSQILIQEQNEWNEFVEKNSAVLNEAAQSQQSETNGSDRPTTVSRKPRKSVQMSPAEMKIDGNVSPRRRKLDAQEAPSSTSSAVPKGTIGTSADLADALMNDLDDDKAEEEGDDDEGKTMDDLLDEIAQLRVDLQQALIDVEQANWAKDKLAGDLEAILPKFDELQVELSQQQESMEQLKATLKETEQELESARKELSDEVQRSSLSTQQLIELSKQLQSVQRSLQESEDQKNELDQKLKDLTSETGEPNMLRQQIETMKRTHIRQIEKMKFQLSDAEKAIESSRKIIETQQQIISSNKTSVATVNELQKQIEKMQEDHKNELKTLEDNLTKHHNKMYQELMERHTQQLNMEANEREKILKRIGKEKLKVEKVRERYDQQLVICRELERQVESLKMAEIQNFHKQQSEDTVEKSRNEIDSLLRSKGVPTSDHRATLDPALVPSTARPKSSRSTPNRMNIPEGDDQMMSVASLSSLYDQMSPSHNFPKSSNNRRQELLNMARAGVDDEPQYKPKSPITTKILMR